MEERAIFLSLLWYSGVWAREIISMDGVHTVSLAGGATISGAVFGCINQASPYFIHLFYFRVYHNVCTYDTQINAYSNRHTLTNS
jgi:hypothetical protein